MSEREIRRYDEIGLFLLQIANETGKSRNAHESIQDFEYEGVVDAPVERIDQRRIAQGLVPVVLVDVAQEAHVQFDSEVHHVDFEVLAAEDIELLIAGAIWPPPMSMV